MARTQRRDVVKKSATGPTHSQLKASDLAHSTFDAARYITVAHLRVYADLQSQNSTYLLLKKLGVPIVYGRVDLRHFDRAMAAAREDRHAAHGNGRAKGVSSLISGEVQ